MGFQNDARWNDWVTLPAGYHHDHPSIHEFTRRSGQPAKPRHWDVLSGYCCTNAMRQRLIGRQQAAALVEECLGLLPAQSDVVNVDHPTRLASAPASRSLNLDSMPAFFGLC
jgi:hypothetical protein